MDPASFVQLSALSRFCGHLLDVGRWMKILISIKKNGDANGVPVFLLRR